ncbi:MAG: Holliday junction resolvase RuvX [Paludibacteraceae bacterium]|nr:Holliday junction resolvase RuvX [Paludibacteraceae bacterium]
MGRILAIDYGKKRTGLAVTDILRLTANPLTTIPTGELISWLRNELNKGEIDLVIIGKPTQMNGQESESMNYIRPFMQTFRQTWPAMPLVEYDERFTSTLAHRAMIDGGMKRSQRRDKAVVDKIAACIILEGYLDSLGN